MRNLLTGNGLLWILQSFLALFFIGASGAPKLALPAEALPMPIPLPQAFVWFIGTCEVLGGLGLLVPRLTVLSATCLAILTVCAATYQMMGQQPGNAVFALVIGALAGVVVYGRTRAKAQPKQRIASAVAVTGP
jgi:putative oxidoreductase